VCRLFQEDTQSVSGSGISAENRWWNVSGISGAAPVWVEIMDFLHRQDEAPRQAAPAGLVRKEIQFPQGIESFRKEWFIRGTEPGLKEQKPGQFNPRIVYPPAGTGHCT